MDGHNSFLKEFLNMRKTIVPSSIPVAPAAKKKDEKKKKRPIEPTQTTESAGLAEIVENKPNKKVVIEYLQKRANELSAEKMK